MNEILVKVVIIVVAVALNHWLGAYMVRRAVAAYADSVPETDRVLVNAGLRIGQLERFLIFLFVMTGNVSGVGFLLTAKSVFRFGDIKDNDIQKRTEYYLIGSLASFTFALLVSFIAQHAFTHS